MARDPRESENGSPPPNILKIMLAFRRAGWVGFWFQLVLGIIASVTLLFTTLGRGRSEGSTPGADFGMFLAFLSLLILAVSIYWAFRYTQISRKLRANEAERPSRAQTVKQLRIGLLISMIGLIFTVLSAETVVGLLVAKAVTQPQGGFVNPESFNRTVQPIDIYAVQAIVHAVFAHVAGLATSLWLLNLTTERSN